MNNIYKAFYNNTKRIVECQKGGSDAPQNKINEITAAINMMEEICKPDAELFSEGQEGTGGDRRGQEETTCE